MSQTIDFVNEAIQIVAKAQQSGLTLRVLGATAFRLHCPDHVHVHISMGRDITDIDFAAYSKEGERIEKFLAKDHFQAERQKASLTPGLYAGRHIYENPETGLHVDIFEDELNMCHLVNFRNRLHLDSPTIPLADLALEKFQIVRINEKDIRDMLMLFAAHPVGESEHETINGKYIAAIMSKEWGFYYTTTMNLGKIRKGLERYKDLFTAQDVENIQERITHLEQMIAKAPKSLAWKARSAIGTRVQWYNDVEEVERAEHLQNLDV
ncbi:MAG: hypothetical protein L0Z70_04935 [Chloroflexi bacterium]|nr:hypothetical protein [Chloroflexota bacterium]